MTGLTKQDIQILMEGVDAWAQRSPDALPIVDRVIGAAECQCLACVISKINTLRAEIYRLVDEERKSKKERAVILGAKLIAMRDSIVADELFDSVSPSPPKSDQNV